MGDSLREHIDNRAWENMYYSRMLLFSVICKTYRQYAWRSKLRADGTEYDNYFMAGITTPKGDFSYYFKIQDWVFFKDLPEKGYVPKWAEGNPEDLLSLLDIPLVIIDMQ